jgi:hypothetical protein
MLRTVGGLELAALSALSPADDGIGQQVGAQRSATGSPEP